MGHAVKTVTANMVLLGEFVVDRVGRGSRRNGRVKCRIENRRHRQRRAEDFSRRINAAQRRRIMQRREIVQRLDLGQSLIVERRCRSKKIGTVHHPVADRINASSGSTGQVRLETIDNQVHGSLVIGRSDFLSGRTAPAGELDLQR